MPSARCAVRLRGPPGEGSFKVDHELTECMTSPWLQNFGPLARAMHPGDRPAGFVKVIGESPLLPHHRRKGPQPGSGRLPGAAGAVSQVGIEAPVVPKLVRQAECKPAETERLLQAEPGAPSYVDPVSRFDRSVEPAAEEFAARAAVAVKRDALRPVATPASSSAPWLRDEERARQRSPQRVPLNVSGEAGFDPISGRYVAGEAGARLQAADRVAREHAIAKATLQAKRDSHGRDFDPVTNLPQLSFLAVPGASVVFMSAQFSC